MVRQKRCKKCSKIYKGDDEIRIAFRLDISRGIPRENSRNICRLCDQDNRTPQTDEDRWRAKAINTRRSHSKRLSIPVKNLEVKHGWDIGQMAHDAAFYYQNGCPECHHPYSGMKHGFRDITLDIWDKKIEPDYGANTRWVCDTCNKAKGDMPPEDWAIYKRLWREREVLLIEQSMKSKPKQLSLFDEDNLDDDDGPVH